MNNIIRFFIYNALFILIGCTDYIEESQRAARIILSAEIKQEAVSRVNDNGFTDGDMMGVYVVDYNGSVPGELQTRGNRADNVRFTYNGSNNSWTGSQDIYWLDNHTCIDVYGYYPYDKTLSDTISNLGLSNNDFDEEAAIDRLIEEDRKEKQRQDEENRRLREENEKKHQQETGFVINERKGGTVNQTTNRVKPNSIIDDDDDIIDV